MASYKSVLKSCNKYIVASPGYRQCQNKNSCPNWSLREVMTNTMQEIEDKLSCVTRSEDM